MVIPRLIMLGALSGSCAGSLAEPRTQDPEPSPASLPLLIRDVRVITMTGEQVLTGRSVLVGSGRIEAIGGSEL